MIEFDVYQYKSEVVGRYIAAYANSRKIYINITKIQKLLYIAYGVCLAIKDKRLVNEHPQAWPSGPVFPIAREKLLKEILSDINTDDPALAEIVQDKEANALMELIFGGFGKKTASFLSDWSRESHSPWDKTYRLPYFKWGDEIPDKFIQPYFESIVTEKAEEENEDNEVSGVREEYAYS
jgi:uncharacterized phage-associated protein